MFVFIATAEREFGLSRLRKRARASSEIRMDVSLYDLGDGEVFLVRVGGIAINITHGVDYHGFAIG